VWFEQLKRDPAALARARADAGTRPSAFSYAKRVQGGRLIEDRMDYIFASGLQVGQVVYDQAGRGPGLSDHALVTAEVFFGE
jgi:endonuclease/exonuclease/phosphatase (EEP) superfamily protein YafD